MGLSGAYLLSRLVQLTIRLEVEVNVDEVSTGKKLLVVSMPSLRSSFPFYAPYLKDHARRNDRRYTQLHQCTPVTRHHHSQPV